MNRYFSDCHAVKFKIEIKRIYTTDGDIDIRLLHYIKDVFILQFSKNISSLFVKNTRLLGISYYTMKEAKQYSHDMNNKL